MTAFSDDTLGDLSSDLDADPEPQDVTGTQPGTTGDPVSDGASAEWQAVDPDGDGYAQVLVRVSDAGGFEAVVDTDLDGVADDAWVADANGDGEPDLRVLRSDGGYLVQLDADVDGVFEREVRLTHDELVQVSPEVAALLAPPDAAGGDPAQSPAQSPVQSPLPPPQDASEESPWGDPAPEPEPAPEGLVEDGRLVGDPAGASEHWFEQAANGFCAPACITQIVAEYTGVPALDEQGFVSLANELRVFTVGPDGVPGMSMDGAEELLEAAGVPAEQEAGDTSSLLGWLEEGRGVMVAVDSGELWYGEQAEGDAADHAVLVTGVDTERGVVYLSDPGHPDGDAVEYPLSQFEDAWADSGGAALVCDEPSPDAATEEVAGAAPSGPVGEHLGSVDGSEVEAGPAWPGAGAVAALVQRAWALLPVVLTGVPGR